MKSFEAKKESMAIILKFNEVNDMRGILSQVGKYGYPCGFIFKEKLNILLNI